MRLERDQNDNELVVLGAESKLDGQSTEELIHRIERLIHAGVSKVIVDLSRVEHVSSHGLGLLIRLHHRLRRTGGDLKIAGASPAAMDALRMTRLHQVFDIFSDVKTAKQAFTAAAA